MAEIFVTEPVHWRSEATRPSAHSQKRLWPWSTSRCSIRTLCLHKLPTSLAPTVGSVTPATPPPLVTTYIMQPHSHNPVGPDQTRHSQQSQHHHPYQARPASSSSAVGSTSSASRPRTANSVSPNNTSSDRPPKPPRKLNRSANQLHRNQACLPCRRRRIKCDAAKPHCSSCIRSFRFLARTQPDPEREARGVQCVYEESTDNEPVGGGGVEGASQPSLHVDPDHPRNTVLKLEGRIGE